VLLKKPALDPAPQAARAAPRPHAKTSAPVPPAGNSIMIAIGLIAAATLGGLAYFAWSLYRRSALSRERGF
jgi:hypothetical protein